MLVLAGLMAAYWTAVQAYRWVVGNRITAAGITTGVVSTVVLLGWVRWRQRRARVVVRRMLDRHIGAVDEMSPRGVEELVARLLQRDGFVDVRVQGGAGDLGADVTGRFPDGRRIVVQVKHYSNPIGSPALQTFNGTCWSEHGADVAVFVTSSSFTRAASEFAARSGIELVDRVGLAAWMGGESMGSAA